MTCAHAVCGALGGACLLAEILGVRVSNGAGTPSDRGVLADPQVTPEILRLAPVGRRSIVDAALTVERDLAQGDLDRITGFGGVAPQALDLLDRDVVGSDARDVVVLHAANLDKQSDSVKQESDLLQKSDARSRLAENLRATLDALQARRLRLKFSDFVQASWHVLEPETPLEWNWHHGTLCDHLQALFEQWQHKGKDPSFTQAMRNLVANVPPGSLKSRIVSVSFLAWVWLRAPGFKVIALSENPQVALRDADYCRELLRSRWYAETFRPAWGLRDDQDALGNFGNTAGGNRRSFGAATKVTGLRADAIVADDPNDAFDVMSPVSRAGTNGRWTRTSNRVNDERRSFRVIIQQRLHAEDLTGFVLEQNAWRSDNVDGWILLMLPTEYDPDRACVTPLPFRDPRTVAGESLHPARYTPSVINAERTRLGAYGYAGQHDQNPSPSEGGMFPRRAWRFFRFAPGEQVRARPHGCMPPDESPARIVPLSDLDWLAITCDATFTGNAKTSDRVGLQVWGGRGPDRFLVRDWTKVRSFKQTCDDIRALRADFPRATKILVEKKANGDAILETLGAELGGLVAINPMGGKSSRAFAVSPYVESGNCYLLDGADFVADFVEETAVFPNGKHDDRVDAMTQLLIEYGVSPALAKLQAAYGR